jgi:hypothetical protein
MGPLSAKPYVAWMRAYAGSGMPTIGAVGKSILRAPFDAGREAAMLACERLDRGPHLFLVFATAGYDQAELLSGVRSASRGTAISGCSGEGIITQAGSDEISHAVAVMAIASDRATFDSFQVSDLSKDARRCGAELASQIEAVHRRDPQCLLVFPDGRTGNVTDLLRSLQEHLPYPLPIAGGAAAEQFRWGKTYQYSSDRAANDAVSAVLISGRVRMRTSLRHGCTPLGSPRTVTKAEDGWVRTIDDIPACTAYMEYLEEASPESALTLKAQFEAIQPIFGEELPPDQRRFGRYILRLPLGGVDEKTGALFFSASLRQGAKIQLMRRDRDLFRTSARDCAQDIAAAQGNLRPALVFQFDCAGRGRVMFGDQTSESIITPMQEVLGRDLPWIGFHTYGEIAPLNEQAVFHQFTVVLSAIYEVEEAHRGHVE